MSISDWSSDVCSSDLKFVRGVNACLEYGVPYVCFSATGGARMQESLFSLLQLAKTSEALAKLGERGLPFVSVLPHPTMGGVSASCTQLGHIPIAEPKALNRFSATRVVKPAVVRTLLSRSPGRHRGCTYVEYESGL